jgi:hypothetical protein
LVALDREQVIAALFDDLAAHVTLAEHRIAEDDATLDGQDTQQLQGGLVFIGLGLDANLPENGLVFMGVGRHQVVAGRVAIAAAPQGLAVQRDG